MLWFNTMLLTCLSFDVRRSLIMRRALQLYWIVRPRLAKLQCRPPAVVVRCRYCSERLICDRSRILDAWYWNWHLALSKEWKMETSQHKLAQRGGLLYPSRSLWRGVFSRESLVGWSCFLIFFRRFQPSRYLSIFKICNTCHTRGGVIWVQLYRRITPW